MSPVRVCVCCWGPVLFLPSALVFKSCFSFKVMVPVFMFTPNLANPSNIKHENEKYIKNKNGKKNEGPRTRRESTHRAVTWLFQEFNPTCQDQVLDPFVL